MAMATTEIEFFLVFCIAVDATVWTNHEKILFFNNDKRSIVDLTNNS